MWITHKNANNITTNCTTTQKFEIFITIVLPTISQLIIHTKIEINETIVLSTSEVPMRLYQFFGND